MAMIEDFTGKYTVLAFRSNEYEAIKACLKDDSIVKMKVKVRCKNSDISLMIESVDVLNSALAQQVCHVDIIEGNSADELSQIQQVCLLHKGSIPLYFHVDQHIIEANKKFWIKEDAIPIIQTILGDQKVWIEQ